MARHAGPEEQWPLGAENYELGVVLHKEKHYSVFRAFCPKLGRSCSIKKLHMEDFAENFEQLHDTVQALISCKHPHIMKCHASFTVESTLWLIMPDFCITAGQALARLAPRGFSREIITILFSAAASAVAYLHQTGLIHRNIRADTICIGAEGQVMLGGFLGAASLIRRGRKRSRKTFVGSVCWMAPEVARCSTYDEKADVWSLGVTFLEFVTGKPPLHELPPLQQLLEISKGDPPSFQAAVRERSRGTASLLTRDFEGIVSRCLAPQPADRPTARVVLDELARAPPVADPQARLVRAIVQPVLTAQEIPRAASVLQPEHPPSEAAVPRADSAPGFVPVGDGDVAALARQCSHAALDGAAPPPDAAPSQKRLGRFTVQTVKYAKTSRAAQGDEATARKLCADSTDGARALPRAPSEILHDGITDPVLASLQRLFDEIRRLRDEKAKLEHENTKLRDTYKELAAKIGQI
eukprot:gnl/Chilomastix_cuspidata/1723.p1 GENE.gnl/Chilomastix_cuspidata/1723~~gnl/Chilomastix_cuspidata/1723.p1  ORF type:complete len:468 (-),score=221.68 gnl/Chilomastix_cuspidata/1723:554-1957(-)